MHRIVCALLPMDTLPPRTSIINLLISNSPSSSELSSPEEDMVRRQFGSAGVSAIAMS